jgi:hypothetical protein
MPIGINVLQGVRESDLNNSDICRDAPLEMMHDELSNVTAGDARARPVSVELRTA